MTCGEKIQKLRKEKNYTQEDLADIVNVSRQSVSRWESDIAFPETDKIIALSKLFKCSIDYLLNSENDERNLVAEKKKPSFDGKARLPLAIATICAMLLTIGLFFCNWFECSVEVGEALGMSTLDVTILLNYYKLAFYGLKVYWSYANILAMFSFILIVGAIILAILYIIFDCKPIAYALTTINIVIPVSIINALTTCSLFNIKPIIGVSIPVLIVLIALVIFEFTIKQIRDNTIFKISPLPIATLFVTGLSLITFGVPIIGQITYSNGVYKYSTIYTYYYLMVNFKNVAISIFALVYINLAAVSAILSIVLLVKKDDRLKKIITVMNVATLLTFICSIVNISNYASSLIIAMYLVLFICQIFVKGMNDEAIMKRSPLPLMTITGSTLVIYLLSVCPWFKYDEYLYSKTSYVHIAGYTCPGAVYGFYSVLAAIALSFIALSIVLSCIYLLLGNKYIKFAICIINSITPILILLSLIFAKYPYWNRMGILLALIYVAMNVCQYVIKPLRPVLSNKISNATAQD